MVQNADGDVKRKLTPAEAQAEAVGSDFAAAEAGDEGAAERLRERWEMWPLNLGPEGDAYRMVAAAGARMLVALANPRTAPGKAPSLLTLRDDDASLTAGLWQSNADADSGILSEANALGREWTEVQFRQDLDDGMEAKAAEGLRKARLRYLSRAPSVKAKEATLLMPEVQRVGTRMGRDLPLRICDESKLDANPRYMGFRNGVVDLEELELLTGGAAADLLITITTGWDWDPDAWHADADAVWNPPMLQGRDAELLTYVQQSLAWSVRGLPDKAFNLLVDTGEGGGGKTTLLTAVGHALGQYGGSLDSDVLKSKAAKSDRGGATPELENLAIYRLGYVVEANQANVGAERFKSITGGDEITYRRLYGNLVSKMPTCSVWAAGNSALRVDLTAGAELLRYRPIPMPRIPDDKKDESLRTAFNPGVDERELRCTALLTLMITTLAGMDGPPAPPQAILDLAEEHRVAAAGTVGEWIRSHIVPVADGAGLEAARLSLRDAYEAFGKMEPAAQKGMRQAEFSKQVTAAHQIDSKQMRIAGKVARGWQGLTLTDDAWQALPETPRQAGLPGA